MVPWCNGCMCMYFVGSRNRWGNSHCIFFLEWIESIGVGASSQWCMYPCSETRKCFSGYTRREFVAHMQHCVPWHGRLPYCTRVFESAIIFFTKECSATHTQPLTTAECIWLRVCYYVHLRKRGWFQEPPTIVGAPVPTVLLGHIHPGVLVGRRQQRTNERATFLTLPTDYQFVSRNAALPTFPRRSTRW
jgi:hypothetical protein